MGPHAEANEIAPGPRGSLAWINDRCVRAGMHDMDPWWSWSLGNYYDTDKLIFAARVGLRGAKSASICRALVRDALFDSRELDPGSVGVIPIMSSDRSEATDRFVTIRHILQACGISPAKSDGNGRILGGGFGGEFTSATTPAGGGVIRLQDSQEHAIEFRIYPAKRTAAVGYTAIDGFCDEVDLWRDVETGANPADVVLDLLLKRFTTQARARLYVVSASYNPDSAHARTIAAGDTAIQYVARLGEIGARRDNEARARLAVSASITDERLSAPADPLSVDVPAWVTNPVTSIDRCYALSRNQLGTMLGQYGGRVAEAGKRDAVDPYANTASVAATLRGIGAPRRAIMYPGSTMPETETVWRPDRPSRRVF